MGQNNRWGISVQRMGTDVSVIKSDVVNTHWRNGNCKGLYGLSALRVILRERNDEYSRSQLDGL